MKHNKIVSAIIALTIVTGCGNSSDEETTTSTPAVPAATNTTISTDTIAKPVQTVVQQPIITTVATQPVQTNQLTTATVSKAGLNPEHGKPGHRCDISVGAPLDSKPNQPVVTNPNPQVVTPTQQAPATTQPVAVAPGMNPSHGQPGHRCDIAVGAPLNSKPAQ